MTLTEHFWRPSDDPERTRSLLQGIETPEAYDAAYAVTAGSEDVVILSGCGDSVPTGGTPLADHLRLHPPTGLWDAAFVVDAFVLSNPMYTSPAEMSVAFEPLPLVDEVLRDSRGILVWTHQVEMLYAAFGHGAEACVAFRKGIGARRAEAFEAAARLDVGAGVSLRDAIEARMRFSGVTRPSLTAARILMG